MLETRNCLGWLAIIDEELSKLEDWRNMCVDDKLLILKMYASTHEQRMIFTCAMQAVKAQFTHLMS